MIAFVKVSDSAYGSSNPVIGSGTAGNGITFRLGDTLVSPGDHIGTTQNWPNMLNRAAYEAQFQEGWRYDVMGLHSVGFSLRDGTAYSAAGSQDSAYMDGIPSNSPMSFCASSTCSGGANYTGGQYFAQYDTPLYIGYESGYNNFLSGNVYALILYGAPANTLGTSTTSMTVGTTAQTFTTQAGLSYVSGQPIQIANSPSTYMDTLVSSYNSSTGVLVTTAPASFQINGSGTFSSWSIASQVGPSDLQVQQADTILGSMLNASIGIKRPTNQAPVLPPVNDVILPTLVVCCDSITSGITNSASSVPWPQTSGFAALLNQTYTIQNLGLAGWNSGNVQASLATFYGPAQNRAAPGSVFVNFFSTNDMQSCNASLSCATNAYNAHMAVSSFMTQAGFRVVEVSTISRTGTGVDTTIGYFNALLRTGWKSGGAVSFVDLAANPIWAAGGFSNSTYYLTSAQDGVGGTHPTLTGAGLVAAAIAVGINTANASATTQDGISPVVTASATVNSGAVNVLITGSTAAQTLTLFTPISNTGRSVKVSNQSTQSWTVATAAGSILGTGCTSILSNSQLTYTTFDGVNWICAAGAGSFLQAANNLSDVATKATAFNNISPLTTPGDLLYGGTSGAGTRLPAGTNTQLLIGGTTESWGAVNLTTMVTGILPSANGGTGVNNGTATLTLGTANVNFATFTTGIPKITTTTGAFTTAVAADFPTLNQNTTGAAGSVTGETFPASGLIVGTTDTQTLTNKTFVAPALGTPASGNASNLTNLPITLTTTGSSGAATYTQSTNTLNIPNYAGGGASGTVTSIATTGPITGGTITTTGTIACATCVTSASSLTNLGVMVGAGSQASQTSSQLTVANLGTPATEAWTITNAINSTTTAGGLTLTNSTAATSGNQKVSPQLTLIGNAFNISSSTSVAQSYTIDVLPIQSAGFPYPSLRFNANASGGGANSISFNAYPSTSVASLDFNTINGTISSGTGFSSIGGNVINALFQGGSSIQFGGNTPAILAASGLQIGWANTSSFSSIGAGSADMILTRSSAATIHLGAADAAAPVAQTLGVQGVVAGTSNTAGANFTIAGSVGTGTAAGGLINLQNAIAGTTGTAQNALVTVAQIGPAGVQFPLGFGLTYKAGSNPRTGSGTLSGGTLAISNTSITANSSIFIQDQGGGVVANIGSLYVASQTAGTGFTVSSSNALDTSTFKYWILETN